MYELQQKEKLISHELTSQILKTKTNAAEVAKSAPVATSLKLLHSGNKESCKLMGVHITHNLLDEKGTWFP